MRVFVTGSDGFLGGTISRSFAAAGHEVDDWGKQDGALVSTKLQERFSRRDPEVVIHAAGPAVVGASMENPLEDFQRGSGSTAEVLEAVRRTCPEARVVFLSSAAVYGDPEVLPVAEKASLKALSPYGFNKRISETLLEKYRTIFGVRSVSLRIFSAYGEGLKRQVLWDICRKAREGCLLLQGDGSQSRDFIHRDDVASAVLHLAEHSGELPETANLAYGREVTIAEAAGWVVDELGISEPVRYDGVVPAGNPQRWEADMSVLKSLGWEPRITPETGIRAFARWADEALRNQR